MKSKILYIWPINFKMLNFMKNCTLDGNFSRDVSCSLEMFGFCLFVCAYIMLLFFMLGFFIHIIFIFCVSVTQKPRVAFMTTLQRELFPFKVPPNRFGNEITPLRGAPHRGPGCYNNEEVCISV